MNLWFWAVLQNSAVLNTRGTNQEPETPDGFVKLNMLQKVPRETSFKNDLAGDWSNPSVYHGLGEEPVGKLNFKRSHNQTNYGYN